MKRLTVTEVVEEDTDRVLLAGFDKLGKKTTFHIQKDDSGYVDNLISLVKDGEHVEVEM